MQIKKGGIKGQPATFGDGGQAMLPEIANLAAELPHRCRDGKNTGLGTGQGAVSRAAQAAARARVPGQDLI